MGAFESRFTGTAVPLSVFMGGSQIGVFGLETISGFINCSQSTSVKLFNPSVGVLGLKPQRPLSNRHLKGERGSLGICSDIHSLFCTFNQHLLNTFFIRGVMFLLTTSGTPVTHHSAHTSAASLLARIVIVWF